MVRLDGCRAYLSYQSEPDVERKVEILGGGLLVEDGESETQRWRRVGPSTGVGGVVAGLLISPKVMLWSKILDLKDCWQFVGLTLTGTGEVPATAATALFHRDQTDDVVLSVLSDCALTMHLCEIAQKAQFHTDASSAPRNFPYRLLRIQDGGYLE